MGVQAGEPAVTGIACIGVGVLIGWCADRLYGRWVSDRKLRADLNYLDRIGPGPDQEGQAMRALIVHVDVWWEVVEQDTWSLDDLQKIVGGYIESLSGHRWTAYINEEGKLQNLEPNDVATAVATFTGWLGGRDDYLAGDVIFFGEPDDNGNETDVPEELIGLMRLSFPDQERVS